MMFACGMEVSRSRGDAWVDGDAFDIFQAVKIANFGVVADVPMNIDIRILLFPHTDIEIKQ